MGGSFRSPTPTSDAAKSLDGISAGILTRSRNPGYADLQMPRTLPFVALALAAVVLIAAVPAGSQVQLAKSGPKSKLIKVTYEDRVFAINPDLVDKVDAYKTDEAMYEVHLSMISELTGEEKEIVQLNMNQAAVNQLIDQINKGRE